RLGDHIPLVLVLFLFWSLGDQPEGDAMRRVSEWTYLDVATRHVAQFVQHLLLYGFDIRVVQKGVPRQHRGGTFTEIMNLRLKQGAVHIEQVPRDEILTVGNEWLRNKELAAILRFAYQAGVVIVEVDADAFRRLAH